MTESSMERRRNTRYSHGTFSLKLSSMQQDELETSFSVNYIDFSQGGLGFYSEKLLPQNDIILINVQFEHEHVPIDFDFIATILRVTMVKQTYRYGVSFHIPPHHHITEKDKQKLFVLETLLEGEL